MSVAQRRRILFFLNSTVRGGVEEVVLSLLKGLPAERFEPHLAAPPALLQRLEGDLSVPGLKILPLELRSWGQWREIWALVRYLRRHRIEIVNSHLFCATFFAAPLARFAGVPCVVETCHGPEAWRRSWWKKSCLVDRAVELFVTLNIAVSEANRQYLQRTKGYPSRKLRVVPNGRDLSAYGGVPHARVLELRAQLGLSAGDRVAVVVGRLEEQKGHRYLLEALPELVSVWRNFKVILVGEGSLRSQLQAQCTQLHLEQHLIFAGHRSDVTPFYSLAEFVILPSLYEGMPLAAIEAGAAGRALIATSVDGTVEVVEPERTGVLVPKESPEHLAAAISDLLAHSQKAAVMGCAARKRIEALFSLERQIAETARLFDELAPAHA
jgi:glycosyltransferase involved in cell wall biosynthesis